MARILIVDDDVNHADATAEALDRSGRDYECVTANDGEEAQHLVASSNFDLVLLDLKLPDVDGMTLLSVWREEHPETEVIIMTGFASVNHAVEALQKGAYSFLEKPLQRDQLRNQVAKALERQKLASDNKALREIVEERYGIEGMIGSSSAMQAVYDRIRMVAPTDARILITGPNGSGKELVARAIHFNSKRAKGRLVAFNCASITGDLLQAELFGHEKGAFTGADDRRVGRFEFAHGGTLFLDEIGEMPLEAQAKLLRTLETGEITRLGSNIPIAINVRVISATNKDLVEEVKLGRFREDLYFRLKVIEIALPALAERGGDVLLLAEAFLREFAKKYERPLTSFAPEVANALLAHSWPGNVRELRNAIEEMVVLSSGERVEARVLPPSLGGEQAALSAQSKPELGLASFVGSSMRDIEEAVIRATLRANDGNRQRSAEILQIGERTLYRKIKEYGISSEDTSA